MRALDAIDEELRQLVRNRTSAREEAERYIYAADKAQIRAETCTMRIDILLLERMAAMTSTPSATRETSAVPA